MHEEAIHFTKFVKTHFPHLFKNKKVLDVGSYGNNRFLFEDCDYTGKDLPFQDETFDTIISTECFEHDSEYAQSFQKIYSMLKSGGLFCFTCASIGRPEHGTRRTTPADSYGTMGMLTDMQDYYKNLTIQDVNEVLSLNDSFIYWDSYYNAKTKDLYFYAIKKSNVELIL